MIMSSDDSIPLTIGCQAEVMNGPKLHFVIEFESGAVRADHVEMSVCLRVESNTYETGRCYYWWNIRDFAHGLAKMHSELMGRCTLSDWDGETVLCLAMLDSVRGLIGVGGQLNQDVFLDK